MQADDGRTTAKKRNICLLHLINCGERTVDSQPEHRPEVQEVSFMELRKENIHRLGSQGAGDAGGVTMQLTLDDDFNVPDRDRKSTRLNSSH